MRINHDNKKLDRYKLRELERMVEKKRRDLNSAAQECPDFEEMDVYLISFDSARTTYASAKTPAEKDWAFINQLAATLEIKRLQGGDVSEGARSMLPSSILPNDPFPQGDRSL